MDELLGSCSFRNMAEVCGRHRIGIFIFYRDLRFLKADRGAIDDGNWKAICVGSLVEGCRTLSLKLSNRQIFHLMFLLVCVHDSLLQLVAL